ncbi:hypothetical protein [Desulfovibrio litoralis]|uniref:DUF2802 domain-containing protein n=1 Tax=Desulfovibrio litoralis DSM 11393 TaxID=1121455 RepID=A0A1M7TD09_9BACT|nr:hypothetical protein [Desulfovibrio litoralis]SHN68566.1 hypothetical protein SAMN02745728_01853 [Desulfovibrio litoralis DSM 11393]
MQPIVWLLALVSVMELLLLFLILMFFWRLRRSETALSNLQANQEDMLIRLAENASLEQELVNSFAARQQELRHLDGLLQVRAEELKRLLDQATNLTRSPQFLREVIRKGHQQGKSPMELARATGLSLDEVELLLSDGELG